MPQRSITVNSQSVDLTAEQYDEFVQLTGKPAKLYLDEFMATPEWRSMPDPERVEFVKETLAEFRDIGRDALKARYPELAGAVAAEKAGVKLRPRSLSEVVPPEYIKQPGISAFNGIVPAEFRTAPPPPGFEPVP